MTPGPNGPGPDAPSAQCATAQWASLGTRVIVVVVVVVNCCLTPYKTHLKRLGSLSRDRPTDRARDCYKNCTDRTDRQRFGFCFEKQTIIQRSVRPVQFL